MTLHETGCPWWAGQGASARCTCPRIWVIRKSVIPTDPAPWRVYRLMHDQSYELFLRAAQFAQATALVSSLTGLRADRAGLADVFNTARSGGTQDVAPQT